MEPFIGFTIFISIIFVLTYTTHKKRQSQFDFLVEKLQSEIILHVEQIKVDTFTIGNRTKIYHFRTCDFILTNNAIIFLGYNKENLIFKNYINPIILTSENDKYNDFISFSNFLDIFSIEIIEEKVKLKFGKKGLFGIDIRVIIDCLTSEELNLIKKVAINNNWKSPYYNPILP